MPLTFLTRPYLKLSGNDALTLLNAATQWDDARSPASSAGPAVTNPGYNVFQTNGAGSTGVRAYEFGDPGAEDTLYFDTQLPHGYKTGSDVYPHIHWSPSTAAAGNVGWGLEYTEANINEAFPITILVVPVAIAAAGVALQHQIAGYGAVAKPTREISAMFKIRIYRTDTGGIDTYGASVWVHEFDIHYEVDTIGSREAFVK